MNTVIDKYDVIIAGIITVLSAIFGIYWYIFAAYMALNILDWATGWYKARKLKKESSQIGLKGVIKKLGYWIIIAVAFILSTVFVRMGKDVLNMQLDYLMMIGWFTVACLMVNEVRSILENLAECKYKIPQVLIKGLAAADTMINKESEDK